MPRLLSAANTLEKNQLNSGVVMSMLVQIEIPGTPGPYRLANHDQDVQFHGFTYLKRPFDVDALEDANSMSLVRLRLTLLNVTQEVQSLLENYWAQPTPWTAVVWWPVNMDAPDETPYGTGDVFLVAQVTTDLVNAVADVIASGITLTGTVPKRRYTASSGYFYLPRRIV